MQNYSLHESLDYIHESNIRLFIQNDSQMSCCRNDEEKNI